MRYKRLLWQIYGSFMAATLLALAAAAWLATHSVRTFHQDQTAADLLVRAQIIAKDLAERDLLKDPAAVDRLCKEVGRLTTTRLTVVLADGRVIGDSEKPPA